MTEETRIFELTNEQLDPRIRIFRRIFVGDSGNALQVDAYVLLTERFLIVCDTLLCPADVAFMIASTNIEQLDINKRQWLVINSHSDWDHVWGNAYFLTTSPVPPIIGHTLNAEHQRSKEAQEFLTSYQQRYPLFAQTRFVPPTLTFEQRLTINGGDLTLELFHAPGHRTDHIAGWIPELQTLLAFDAVEFPFPSIEDEHTVGQQIETLQHFLSLEPRHVLFQHGSQNGVADVSIVQRNLDYTKTIKQRCQEFVQHQSQPIHETELEQTDYAALIGYPFSEVSAGLPVQDTAFYQQAHQDNVRHTMKYVLRSL
jgi:glyoxylase-like metal-dependent hydrolase (beta-lactamase superfamily II)